MIRRKIGSVCYFISPLLTFGKEIFVHITRIKKCSADIGNIKQHLGISDPTHEQRLDLFSEIETIEGFDIDDDILDNDV